LHKIRLRNRKTAIYYLLVILLILFIVGIITLRGKSPTKTYFVVGGLSDITEIEAYQTNGTLCKVQIDGTNEELILNLDPPAQEVQIYIRQRVLDSKPNFLSLKTSVSGSHDFMYTLDVRKASFEDGYQYVSIGFWILDSRSDTLALSNQQIHAGIVVERGGNPSDDQIGIVRTDSYGNVVQENVIKCIKIEELAFIKEEEGREPSQPILFDYRFFFLSLYFLLILFILPLIFLKKKVSSLQLLFIVGFLLRISIAPFTSHNFDTLIWKRVGRTFYEEGSVTLFNDWTSPPIWFFTIIAFYAPYILLRILGLPDARIYYQPILSIEVTFIKLPLILSDILSAFLIYKLCQKWNLDDKTSKIAAAVYLFNPFSILISSIWGMFDSLAVLFALLGFYLFIEEKFYLSSLLWGFAVKWYTLAFIPFLTVSAYFQNREEKILPRLAKSALTLFTGFGFFAFLMVFPHIIYGDISYLRQILEFRLKLGGGGGEIPTLTKFTGASFWMLFEHIGVVRSTPNFFLLTFVPLYFIVFVSFFIFSKKSVPKKKNTHSIFNDVQIIILLLFYLTYPKLNPQCILWVLPPLILARFLFNRVSVGPLIIASLITFPNIDLTYYIIGFSVPVFTYPLRLLSLALIYTVSASLVPITLYFLLKLLSPTLYIRISVKCKNLLEGLHRFNPHVVYISVTIFTFVQALAVYAMNLSSPFMQLLLISTILLQGIIFFGMEAKI